MINKLFDLSGRVALITGGNGGIGLGMAEGLASQGCEFAIWGTNPDKNAAALKTLQQYGPKVSALKCDVADQQVVEDYCKESLKHYGRIDGCFENAGIGARKETLDEMEKSE